MLGRTGTDRAESSPRHSECFFCQCRDDEKYFQKNIALSLIARHKLAKRGHPKDKDISRCSTSKWSENRNGPHYTVISKNKFLRPLATLVISFKNVTFCNADSYIEQRKIGERGRRRKEGRKEGGGREGGGSRVWLCSSEQRRHWKGWESPQCHSHFGHQCHLTGCVCSELHSGEALAVKSFPTS